MSKKKTYKTLKVVIAGGRDFDDYNKLKTSCDRVLSDVETVEVVSGRARGADKLGEQYAKERDYKLHLFPADWDRYGRSAGYKRNVQMANFADVVIVFWNGKSVGTKHMIDIVKKQNKPIIIIEYKR